MCYIKNMERNIQRIDGIKYNLTAQTAEELINIREHLIEKHARIVGEIAMLDMELFERLDPQLPLEQ